MRSHVARILFTTTLLLLLAALAPAQKMTAGQGLGDMKFTTLPGLPTCAKGAVASGDPTSGPSIIVAKIATGCVIPWHWHTPIESVMMASGTGRMDMKDAVATTLRSGSVAIMPANHIHQFTCQSSCVLFIHSNVAFDIHYVDKAGKEITPADAMKPVKQTAATEMK